ncbi:MAG TPA: hypothetical protein ENL20_06005 [Candidatus Cloacimonetes bacterium]|nr:hypothetical protein [Candidatus Cloacimonadota bacterium]
MRQILILIFFMNMTTLFAGEKEMKITAQFDYYTTERIANILVYLPEKEKESTIDLIFNDSLLVRDFPLDPGRINYVPFSLQNLNIGKNKILSKLKRSNKTEEIEISVLRLPPRSNEVKIDKATGGMIVDGLPFIPFGFYCYSPVQPTLAEEEVVKGFNMISPYQQIEKKTLKERKKYMDRCAELGMKVNYNLCSVAGGGGAGSDRQKKSEPELEKLLRKEIETFKDHPALLSWYISDEPVGQGMPVEKLKKAYDLIKEMDPYHPVAVVFMTPKKSRTFAEAFDIAMADPYPIPSGNILDVGRTAYFLSNEYFMEKSSWIVPQAFGGGEWWKREPTKNELRMITYHAIINKAVGIQYFVRHGMNSFPKSTSAWAECGTMALEIAELTPYLLSNEPNPEIECSDSSLRVNAWQKGSKIVILALNTKNEPAEMEFSLKDMEFTGDAKLLFENRSIEMKKGKISEFIDAYGTRCYQIQIEPDASSLNKISPLNMTINPSFEDNATVGVPAGCYAKCRKDRGATFFIDSRIYFHGDHSLRLTTPTENEGVYLRFYQNHYKVGKSYTFSIWAKAKKSEFIPDKKRFFLVKLFRKFFKIREKNKKLCFSIRICGEEKIFELTDYWKEFSFTLKALNENKTSTTRIELLGKGTAWFDLMQIVSDLRISQKMKNGKISAEILTEHKNSEIRFTLDGTDPDENSTLYSKPVPINKTSILKASVFQNGEKSGLAEKHFNIHKAVGKKVKYQTKYKKYNAGGNYGLVNGLYGSLYHRDGNWQGFKEDDLSVIIDLGEMTEVNFIKTRFLEKTSSWIFLPESIEIAISKDDKNYEVVSAKKNEIPENYRDAFIQEFVVELKNKKTRFIRILGKNIKKCPDWHNGAGDKSWIFTDEIVVE